MVVCSVCKQDLNAEDFTNSQRKKGTKRRCKKCIITEIEMKKKAQIEEEEQMQSMEASELLLCGYIGNIERDFKLLFNIPNEIYCLIDMYYPKLLKFQLYSSKKFKLSNNGYDIIGRDKWSCSGYIIYSACLVVNGYNKGIHYWSIKLMNSPGCYHNIGVIANIRNIESCNNQWGYIEKFKSYANGVDVSWLNENIITVKLNCDKGIVEYYKNEDVNCIQRDKINNKQSYFFALYSCCLKGRNWYRVVETPWNIP
eukprot:464107_1